MKVGVARGAAKGQNFVDTMKVGVARCAAKGQNFEDTMMVGVVGNTRQRGMMKGVWAIRHSILLQGDHIIPFNLPLVVLVLAIFMNCPE